MFKSASTTNFQNSTFTSSLYTTFGTGLYDSKSPLSPRSKKTGVKFQFQTDKENTFNKDLTLQSSSYKRTDKHTKTWTHQYIPEETQTQNSKNALKQLMGQFNCYKETIKAPGQQSHNPLSKLYQTDNFGFSSKKLIKTDSKKLIQEPSKFERSYKHCKSMKTLPSCNIDEDLQTTPFKPKKVDRKFQKFEAYNELLKQSQNLIEKYKKLQEQKSKLRSDLKNQKESHSKSSKKITFLQQAEASRKYDNTESTYISSYQTKSSKLKDYELNLPKYSNYETYQNTYYDSKYDSKYQAKLSKTSSYGKSMNKTFSSNSKPLYSNQESSYLKPQSNSYTYTYSGTFGLTKTSSSKNLSWTGLSLDDFELGKCLGSGAFGQVFPAKHKKTGWLFALKKVPKQKVKYMLDQFLQQIKIQLFLDHPNIVKLYSFFDDQIHFYILMEYMQGGSLYTYLKKQKTLNLQQTSTKLREVCQGLQNMHQHQILHRDIKPQNIVMSHNVSKLCDFGWSAICKDRRTTYCGTLDYVSPQIIGGDGYDDSVDIWCIGVLTYQLLVGKTPFFNISRKQTIKKIIDCNLQYPSSMPQVAVRFVKNILKKNPDHRQTIEQILKDPLLKISQNNKHSLF